MEIKQGDKVMVSKDAPKVYLSSVNNLFKYHVCKVEETDGDSAKIRYTDIGIDRWLAIPIEYLIKVDAEAKEARFKVGDKVKVNLPRSIRHNAIGTVVFAYVLGNAVNVDFGDDNEPIYCDCDCLEPYTEPTDQTIKVGDRVRNIESGVIGVVDKIVYENIAWVNGVDGKRYHWKSDELELIEPTEQTEAENKPNIGSIKIPVEVDLSDSYWDAYAANLAKEIVLKTVNSASDKRPSVIAEYATDVAKAVVEGLKRK